MRQKPETASGYDSQVVENVKSACLYLATILGDLISDIVVVGGLVPYLMIEQKSKKGIIEKYVGTMDLDLGLSLGLLKKSRYREVSKRLRKANLKPDKNEQGNETFQRWIMTDSEDITVDFLINPSNITDKGGNLQNLEHDFAAVITPGLFLAFKDKLKVTIEGLTIKGERAKRDIFICGAGAYILLKALAFNNRGENKDAYDLYYILRSKNLAIRELFGANTEEGRPLVLYLFVFPPILINRFLALIKIFPERSNQDTFFSLHSIAPVFPIYGTAKIGITFSVL